MNAILNFSENDAKQRTVSVGDKHAGSIAELVSAAPELLEPANLGRYCDALNYLFRGFQYRPIHNADAFRARYEKKFQSEDPNAPFEEGAPRLRDFGHCAVDEIQPPHLEKDKVIFYVENEFLGIPYRVTAPPPNHPEGDAIYAPLSMKPA